jgi:alpha-tubulin suppressor-like RCC1 family protein
MAIFNSSNTSFYASLTDLANTYVNKAYVMDNYPNLLPTVTNPIMYAWGSTATNMGVGPAPVSALSPVVNLMPSAGGIKQIAVGTAAQAAIKTDGTLWMWGTNTNGQLGDNTSSIRSSPISVLGGKSDWKQVSVGYTHTAALDANNSIWCWGSNAQYQLGDGTSSNRLSPVLFIYGSLYKSVAAGASNTFAIDLDGTLWAWGVNTRGQLGDNTQSLRSSPVVVVGGKTWSSVVSSQRGVGTDGTTFAIDTDGVLWSWGNNQNGILGNGSNTTSYSSPISVIGGKKWLQVATNGETAGAIATDGTLWMWGENSNGQLGDNTKIAKSSPVSVSGGGTNWKQLFISYSNANSGTGYALKTNGTIWSWGYNVSGQLGDGTTTSRSSPNSVLAVPQIAANTTAAQTSWKMLPLGGGQPNPICLAILEGQGY